MMLGRPEPWLLFVVLTGVFGEYTWTGTEWKWRQNPPKITRDPVVRGGVWEWYGDEGSDDDDSVEIEANHYYEDEGNEDLVRKHYEKDIEEGIWWH